jgi:enterochelin esterase-like enzyme
MRAHRPPIFVVFFLLFFTLLGCDPLIPVQPTPIVIVISATPTRTPNPTPTAAVTRTPVPTPTIALTPTPTAPPCDEDAGQVLNFSDFRSAIAGQNLPYDVYIPPCYVKTQKRYPYVILLHGAQADQRQWEKIGVVQALDQGLRLGALPPMILVMPYTGLIANDNTFPPDPSYESVVLEELQPAIERDFCTWNNREYRAIGGISRGGFWAFSIALRHPDIFGIVGGHSAFFDPTNAPPENNPLDLALSAPFLTQANLRMYLDNGSSDYVGPNLELFSSRLSSRGIAHTYVINPVGDHDETYWSAHVSDYLEFYGKDWPKDVSALPGCAEPSP